MLINCLQKSHVFQFSNSILKHYSGKIGIITLNNEKKRNTLSLEVMSELFKHFESFHNEQDTKVIIMRAKGPVFSAGHDLKEVLSKNNQDELTKVFELLGKICIQMRNLPQPVIAQVNGMATAGGLQLVLACDLITATTKAQFATSGLKVGLFCTTPAVELIRSLPQTKKALEMLLIAEPISAEEALNSGIINKIYHDSEIDDKTLEFANKIAQFSRQSIALGKQTFYELAGVQDVAQSYKIACKVMSENVKYEDTQEGIKAFIEKRHPNFKN